MCIRVCFAVRLKVCKVRLLRCPGSIPLERRHINQKCAAQLTAPMPAPECAILAKVEAEEEEEEAASLCEDLATLNLNTQQPRKLKSVLRSL